MSYLASKNPANSKEMVELAARICKDYLHDSWKNVNSENIICKHISGGLSNLLYYISLPEDLLEKEQDNILCPKEILIRFYGQTHGESALEALITESVIFTLLSERGLGPKLHGIFPGGRIEEYIKAKPLKLNEMADEKLSELIAKKIAAIHSMDVPLHKSATWLWDTIDRWIKTVEVKQKSVPKEYEKLAKFNFREEVEWLKERIEAENSPVVFCHNDMQEGNILLKEKLSDDEDQEPNIVIIDFEYCSYNYRAFDIANHFAEWLYDYAYKQQPHFEVKLNNHPSEAQRLKFIKTYLNEIGSKENPKQVLKEVDVFTLATHFFWSLWSIINTDSKITFGYWEYGLARLEGYLRAKSEVPPLKAVKRKAED